MTDRRHLQLGGSHAIPTRDTAPGDVRLLHSTTRSLLIQRRDEAIDVADQLAADRARWSLLLPEATALRSADAAPHRP